MMLLVKTDERWRIVSQAWDTERAAGPIPSELLQKSQSSASALAAPRAYFS